MKLIFDIEGNGLLDTLTTIWMIVCKDINSEEVHVFSDHAPNAKPLSEAKNFLRSADTLIGHNIYGYDIPAIQQVLGWEPDWDKQKVVDTLVLSWMVDYKRPGGHSLKNLGALLKCPKDDYQDGFDNYNDNMLRYCIQDVRSNEKVFRYLAQECNKISTKKPLFKKGLETEHRWAYYEMRMRQHGWLFDDNLAKQSVAEWQSRMQEIEDFIEPTLKPRVIDRGETEPRIKKDGTYYASSCKWFEIDPESGKDEITRLLDGPYTKIEMLPAEMGNMDNVKQHLYSLGWEPDDFNVKKGSKGGWIQTGPKLTSSSLEKLDEKLVGTPNEGIGSMIDEYYTLRSRKSVVEGWIKNAKDGRLHPRTWVIGTPTYRCRHEVITNIPSVSSPGGAQMRGMLKAEPGYKVVGADSSGNQFRALAHYMNNADFTEAVINGSSEDGTDVHSRNAEIIGVKRKTAKPFIYALLFGAGDEKLGLIVTGVKNRDAGKAARSKLMKGLKGFKELKDKIDNLFFSTKHKFGRGCIPALDGRLVYPETGHQALNYLLQSFEAITTKAALVYGFDKLNAEGLDWYPTLYMHDEFAIIVREDQADRALEILVEAHREGPKEFGAMIMDGDGAIGNTYADVH